MYIEDNKEKDNTENTLENNDANWWKPGLMILVRVSSAIAVPIVIALFLGKYLDNKYNTSPWIFLSLTSIAFVISLVSIWRSVKEYIENLKKEEEIENN